MFCVVIYVLYTNIVHKNVITEREKERLKSVRETLDC